MNTKETELTESQHSSDHDISLKGSRTPVAKYQFERVDKPDGGSCYTISSNGQVYLLSFGNKTACLTDESKLPLVVIQGGFISNLTRNHRIIVCHPDQSQSRITLDLPRVMGCLPLRRARIKLSDSTTDTKLKYLWRLCDNHWELYDKSNPDLILATLHYAPKSTACLRVFAALPKDFLVVALTSIGFIIFN